MSTTLHRIVLPTLAATLLQVPVALARTTYDQTPAAASAPANLGLTDADRAKLSKSAAYSEKFSGRAVLVMIDGQIVFEQYANGWTSTKPHPLASGSKSFTGTVAAAAVQDGLLTWDELASDTITEWKSDPRKAKITVRHLLSLSSGLDPADALLGGRGGSRVLGQGAADRANRLGPETEKPKDLFRAALDVPAKHDPGTKFEYGPSHYYAFGELLERKLEARAAKDPAFTSTTFEKYMHARLLDPIGLSVGYWGKDAMGHPNLPGGCGLTAREWAKFGRLIELDGAWPKPDGTRTQVIDAAALRELFVPSKTNSSYGLTWWLNNGEDPEASLIADGPLAERVRRANQAKETAQVIGPDGKPLAVRMAAGLGKQRLFVVPALKLVVVRFAEATREGRGFDNREFLLPIVEVAMKPSTPK